MDSCAQCGAELGVGRFCTNCGHPVGEPVGQAPSWRTDTAERPRVEVPSRPAAPRTPPPAHEPPSAARFPLFADEAEHGEEQTRVTPAVVTYDEPEHDEPARHRSSGGWVPWVVGLTFMLVVAGLGAWLLVSQDDDEPASAPVSTGRDRPSRDAEPAPTPSDDGSESQAPPPSPQTPIELAPYSTLDAPTAADPSEDSSGNTTTYVAENMTDGIPETAWRTPGDATGSTITITLDERAVLSEVGMINGYAKTGQDSAGALDWYAGNRRVLSAEWSFDDGTTVTQQLGDTRSMQTLDIGKVRTQTITLRLVSVSAPGEGRASRDYTAISDLRIFGKVG